MAYLDRLPDDFKVVRGGTSAPEDLARSQYRDQCGHILCQVGPCSVEELSCTPEPFPNTGLTVTTVGQIRQSGGDVLAVPMPGNRLRGCIVPAGVGRDRSHNVTADWELMPLPERCAAYPVDTNYNWLGPTKPAISHAEAEAWGLKAGQTVSVRQDDDTWTGMVVYDRKLPWAFQWYILLEI